MNRTPGAGGKPPPPQPEFESERRFNARRLEDADIMA
jgi:hypothetical protein